MIVEWYAIKVGFLCAFIAIYAYRKWVKFNTCKSYEIERIEKL
jgi:hypothetical protein